MYCLGVMTADHTMTPQDGYSMLSQSPVDDSSSEQCGLTSSEHFSFEPRTTFHNQACEQSQDEP